MQRADLRLPALRRFAIAITLLTILGHSWLGFEQAVAHVLVSLATAYSVEIGLEVVSAWGDHRPLRFAEKRTPISDFLLPAHITGLACAMLLYPNSRLWPVAFAAGVGIASKAVLRVKDLRGGTRHVLNPSNTGIVATLLLFPWVGIAPPYQFTENLHGALDWVVPSLVVLSGTVLNARFTRRIPLILGWLGTFAAQATVRALLQDPPLVAPLAPMTGMSFLLFTFYMITDPGTTPWRARSQVLFGASVAVVYGLLLAAHVVFTLFFALAIVCVARGIALYVTALRRFAGVARSPEDSTGASVVALTEGL